jgi:hypothetical protein
MPPPTSKSNSLISSLYLPVCVCVLLSLFLTSDDFWLLARPACASLPFFRAYTLTYNLSTNLHTPFEFALSRPLSSCLSLAQCVPFLQLVQSTAAATRTATAIPRQFVTIGISKTRPRHHPKHLSPPASARIMKKMISVISLEFTVD